MQQPFTSQTLTLAKHFLRLELANLERLFSPILFAATVLLLFFFAFGDSPDLSAAKIFIAETFLTAFFALQIGFARVFDPEQDDQAFQLMRTYPISAEAWFIAKYIVVMLFGLIVICATMGLSAFFSQSQQTFLSIELFLIAFLSIAGMAALGVLLSAMMMRADGKQLLYPLIYFPLTVPVLLSAVQSGLEIVGGDYNWGELFRSWLGLLLIFDVVYITLCVILYGELIKSD